MTTKNSEQLQALIASLNTCEKNKITVEKALRFLGGDVDSARTTPHKFNIQAPSIFEQFTYDPIHNNAFVETSFQFYGGRQRSSSVRDTQYIHIEGSTSRISKEELLTYQGTHIITGLCLFSVDVVG